MPNRYWHPELECAPLPELVTRIGQTLATTDVFRRAAASALYRDRWQAAGIDPAALRTYQDLQLVPFTSSSDLRRAQERYHPNEFAVGTCPPRVWISTSGSTGVPKWIPLSSADIAFDMDIGYRSTFLPGKLPQPGEVAFGVAAPAPFISELSTWLGLADKLQAHGPRDVYDAEGITFSYEAGQEGVAMAMKRRASLMLAFPSLAMRIAEGLAEIIPKVAEQRWAARKNLVNLLAVLVTRRRKLRARDVLKVRTGYFGGEPLGPYLKPLNEAWGMQDAYNIYTFSEYQMVLMDCGAHAGLHVWIDISLPEIISQAELDREREEVGYLPRAKPLWEAVAGEEGELVLTHFSDAFPLVRWRTSDLIEVRGTELCACGRTHPRVSFSQRSDDLVNLGVIRFSIFSLKEKLDAITSPARIARWQLRVGREGYKPRLTIVVRPEGLVEASHMAQKVKEAAFVVEALRTGCEAGLVCEPVVVVDPELGESRSTTGKFRPLVYEKVNGGQA